MSNSRAMRRMAQELAKLEQPFGVSIWPLEEDNLSELRARKLYLSRHLLTVVEELQGPEDSPYEGGIFDVSIKVHDMYPIEPPAVTFLTPVYHPNVDDAGRICLDLLKMPPKGQWRPCINIEHLMTAVRLLLSDPNPTDPLMTEIASEYQQSYALFCDKARQHTRIHAMNHLNQVNKNEFTIDAVEIKVEEMKVPEIPVHTSAVEIQETFKEAIQEPETSQVNKKLQEKEKENLARQNEEVAKVISALSATILPKKPRFCLNSRKRQKLAAEAALTLKDDGSSVT